MLSLDDLHIIKKHNTPLGAIDALIVFVCCQRNASKYIKKCFDSIKEQTIDNWGLVVFDDASDDNTIDIILDELKDIKQPHIVVKNEKRYAKMRNFFYGIRYLVANPRTIIIDIDGDDWLARPDALQIIWEAYLKGAEQTIGTCEFFPKKPIDTRVNLDDTRGKLDGSNNWLHPRTFRKGLFDLIGIETLTNNNHWFHRATDWCYVPYLMEMAKKVTVIPEVLYTYNIEGSNHFIPHDQPKNVFEQFKYKDFITDRIPKYPNLEKLKEEPLGDVLNS